MTSPATSHLVNSPRRYDDLILQAFLADLLAEERPASPSKAFRTQAVALKSLLMSSDHPTFWSTTSAWQGMVSTPDAIVDLRSIVLQGVDQFFANFEANDAVHQAVDCFAEENGVSTDAVVAVIVLDAVRAVSLPQPTFRLGKGHEEREQVTPAT